MDAIEKLVDNIVNINYGDLSKEAILAVKRSILDTIGVTFAGASLPDSEKLYHLISSYSKGGCLAIGFPGQLTAPAAVMLNTFMGRILDFDENDEDTGDHPSVVIIPVALAISETEKNISGKDFITAFVLAADTVLRIRRGSPLKLGQHPWTTGTYAPFAAAAAASKLFKLDKEKTWNALGIAFTECSNTVQSHRDGTDAHRLHQGMAAQAGYLAAVYAKSGFTGVRNILEGEFGFYRVFHSNQYDVNVLLDGLGTHFEGVHLGIKPYPCCRLVHGAIDGILKLYEMLSETKHFNLSDIKEILVKVNRSAFVLCGRQPWTPPKTVVEAQFNIPYAVATALAKGKVTIEEFNENAIRDVQVLSLAGKVRVIIDDDLNKIQRQIVPTIIRLETKTGQIFENTTEYALGDPHNPLSDEEIIGKFMSNMRYAVPDIDNKIAKDIAQSIWGIEELDKVETILKLLRRVHVKS